MIPATRSNYHHASHVLQVSAALLDAIAHRLLRATNPFTWIVEVLVWLVGSVWIADLALQIALLRLVELEDALPIRPLRVRVYVHLHDPVAHGRIDRLLLRTRAAMEDEEVRLFFAQLAFS